MRRTIFQALGKLLRHLGRPARRDSGRRGVVIHPYRGYGSRNEIFVMGRVLRQPRFRELRRAADGVTLIDFARRALRRGLADAQIRARFGEAEARATTDRDGYFRVRLPASADDWAARGWQSVALELETPEEVAGADAEAAVYLRPEESRCVVVSDIDDTVVETGVASFLKMVWNLFFEDVEGRVAYPGVAAFYRQLHAGPSGDQGNPMLYVSRGPWAIYEVLELFFQRHRIPEGPILFLREWGLTLQRPLPPRAKDHKLALIRAMLAVYEDLPFVLIGDSGQQDPEIYARIVQEHPERVRAIYIRKIARSARRDDSIQDLAADVSVTGAELVLADDTVAMARHAAAHGLVGPEVPEIVSGERAHDEALPG